MKRGTKRRRRAWITVYEVTRHYGGPEEGGWWFNWWHPVESQYVPLHALLHRTIKLYAKWKPRQEGNIYSVLGGTEYSIMPEHTRLEHATRSWPHFE